MSRVKQLELLATALAITGAIWLALNLPTSPFAFLLYLASTIIFVVVFAEERRWSMVALNSVFLATNLLAIYRWILT